MAININEPVPGGDFDTWGTKLNDGLVQLESAVNDVDTKASNALIASTAAVYTANSVGGTASNAVTAATAAQAAATSAGSAATAAATALQAHLTSGDPHPQYMNQTRGDLRYVRTAGVTGTAAEPVIVGSAASNGVNVALAFSPYGVRADGSQYYDGNGVPATDRGVVFWNADGTYRVIKPQAVTNSQPDTVAPTLSTFATQDLGSGAVTVKVTSNEQANGIVEYGTTTAYGKSANTSGPAVLLAIPLGNLTPSTLYHYRWKVTDLSGNLTTSADQTFTTSADGSPTVLTQAGTFTQATPSTWAYQAFSSDFASANHWVEADVTGLTDANSNAAMILRGNAGATAGILAIFSGTQFKFETIGGGSAIVPNTTWSGAGTGIGKMRAEIIGTTVSMYWNGTLIIARDLGAAISAFATNKRGGVGVWNLVANKVSLTNIRGSSSVATSSPPDNTNPPPASGTAGAKAQAMFGPTLSGLPWHSGSWVGGTLGAARATYFGTWRGSPSDFITCYPAYATFSEMANSGWVFDLLNGYSGKLNYGLTMLPQDNRGNWNAVNSGTNDGTFSAIANQIKAANRGKCVIRVGLECNGDWFPWSVTWDTADQFIAAFRRIVGIMRPIIPDAKFAFCWSVASIPSGTPGGTSPAAQLAHFYPGDAYVDLIECDTYDFYQVATGAHTDASFNYHKYPLPGAGIGDIADFARARGKGVWLGEWGLHKVQGPGDNPFYMQKMWEWMVSIADILVGECYFNEWDPYIANSLWDISASENQNPNSAVVYKKYWGHPGSYPNGA